MLLTGCSPWFANISAVCIISFHCEHKNFKKYIEVALVVCVGFVIQSGVTF